MSGDSPQAGAVRRFYEAFERQELEEFVALLHPDVELQTGRGLRRGREEARVWATKVPTGELDQRFVVEALEEERNHVLALLRKQWWWRESEQLADEERIAALFTFEDGLICRWQPLSDPGAARGLLARLRGA